MSTTLTSMSGALSAIIAIVGPPTYPAPMQQIFIRVSRPCWSRARQIQAGKGRALRGRLAASRGVWGRGRAGAEPLRRGGLVGGLLLLGLLHRPSDERRRYRRADLAELEDLEDVAALERLVLKERLGDLVERRAALADDLLGPLVLLRDDALDLDVDPPGGLLRDALRPRDV